MVLFAFQGQLVGHSNLNQIVYPGADTDCRNLRHGGGSELKEKVFSHL